MGLRIIAGKFKGRILKTPKSASTRPTQGMLREAVFNICQNEIVDARFLDLFAGSGAMGLEALSRGAAHVTFVEQNGQAIACIKENIAALQVEKLTRIIPRDASRALGLLAGEVFDLIYIDPPYDTPMDLTPMMPLLAANGSLFLEERYDPKRNESNYGLKAKEVRRFGTALLTTFYSRGKR